ncbi:MAG: adenylate/guanylate cyclase domain-containing protein [Chloroflexi bacterium]|nr:adenylate/guanylate cyclase domain-containing protein [Chloroflexota bacterium]
MGNVMQPETQYVRSGDVHIAYQVMGDGPIDLVWVPGFVSHLEHDWEEPSRARFFRRLATFARLIRLDKRGTGLSDRVSEVATLEQRMDDVRAVMDAVGSERAALFGASEGGAMSLLFAATYPARTSALVVYGAMARCVRAEDYPWGPSIETFDRVFAEMSEKWGRTDNMVFTFAPSLAGDARHREWYRNMQRLGASPGTAIALLKMNTGIDVRHVLPTIRVPTLVLHATGDQMATVEHGRYIAERIPDARFVELPGVDHGWYTGNFDRILGEVEEFLTGTSHAVEPDRILATVLFTDIVGSTQRLAELGDERWCELLDEHFRMARRELVRFRGREIKTTGDGLLATFDGPARAIRCATTLQHQVRQLGIEIRAGLHTGEVELLDQDLGGIAVHLGARVMAEAGASEVLVSSTVKDLVAGSGIEFEDRGTHVLKGAPGGWRLFRVVL